MTNIHRRTLTCGLMVTGIVLVAYACDPAPTEPRPLPTSCADPGGTQHSGLVAGTVVWRAADGPHRLIDSVEVDSLTIEAGALVCGAPGAEIWIRGTLTAVGSAEAPIAFSAEDPERPWGGFFHRGGPFVLSHARVEYSEIGIFVNPGAGPAAGPVEITHTLLRRVQGRAIVVGYYSTARLVESTVDSACLAAANCAAVGAFGRYPSLHFEESVIRNSGGDGLMGSTTGSGPNTLLTLAGGTIEGSAGVGLVTGGTGISFDIVKPVRITGGGSYPARVHMGLAAAHLATAANQELWMGNARDTVLAHGYGEVDRVTIRPGLPWSFSAPLGGERIRHLILEAGAGLVVSGQLSLVVHQILSEGTREAPVDIGPGAILLLDDGAGDTRLTHTRLTGFVLSTQLPTVLMQDILGEGATVALGGPGSTVTRTVLRDAPGSFALQLTGDDIQVSDCEITGSAGIGILVESADGVRITGCNIHGTGGPGLRNTAAGVVDARNNWWGDPAGPHGPNGAGVEGNVLFEPWLSEPASWDD